MTLAFGFTRGDQRFWAALEEGDAIALSHMKERTDSATGRLQKCFEWSHRAIFDDAAYVIIVMCSTKIMLEQHTTACPLMCSTKIMLEQHTAACPLTHRVRALLQRCVGNWQPR
jgi:hypothetical protein